jgi:hypothetical protein
LETETDTVIVTTRQKNKQFAVTAARIRCQSESKATDDNLRLAAQLLSGSKRSLSCHSDGIPEESDGLPAGLPALTGPLQRKDIFYSGSVMSLPRDAGTMARQLSTCASDVADQPSPCCRTPATCTTMWEMLDVSLFRNRSFVIICIASVFIQLGYFVPVVFITPYALTFGLSPSAAAMLLSVAGQFILFEAICLFYIVFCVASVPFQSVVQSDGVVPFNSAYIFF